LFSAALLVFRTRLGWPLAPKHQSLVLWGGWLLTGAIIMSIVQHFHEYYLSILGAPLAALVGIGIIELWRLREQRPWLASGLLLAAGSITLGLQLLITVTFVSRAWWLLLAMIFFIGGAGLLIASAAYRLRRSAMAGFACIVAALLLTPGIWSALTVLHPSTNQADPSAYGGRSSGPTNRSDLQVNQPLLDYLEPRTQNITYLMAVPSAMQGAGYVLATGRPVLYIGGFKGEDQVVTGDELAQLVADGKLRYVYWGGGSGGPGGGRGGQADISTWVTTHCTPVESLETTTRNVRASNGMTPPGSEGIRASLYDCGG
jgi:4-amino-4-deoxy-L-arabinose transferase-like glycosyltransferase